MFCLSESLQCAREKASLKQNLVFKHLNIYEFRSIQNSTLLISFIHFDESNYCLTILLQRFAGTFILKGVAGCELGGSNE